MGGERRESGHDGPSGYGRHGWYGGYGGHGGHGAVRLGSLLAETRHLLPATVSLDTAIRKS